jgi:phage tail sheath protein FI
VPPPSFPGVYVEEVASGVHSIAGVSTSTAGFIGVTRHASRPVAIASFAEFQKMCALDPTSHLAYGVRGFFENGGKRCYVACIAPTDSLDAALGDLANAELSLLCCPDEHRIPDAAAAMAGHCEGRKDRVCILQSPGPAVDDTSHSAPVSSSYAAYYHPWLEVGGLDGTSSSTVPPAGHVCGIYARTDIERGVHQAPTGTTILGVRGLSQTIPSHAVESLVARGINLLRDVPGKGIVLWGARTTTSSASEWKYVNVRRLLIFIEQSVGKGLQWAVFEPNGPELWSNVRMTVEDFLLSLWQSGVLVGKKPEEAFFVRCDRSTMSQEDIDSGRVIALAGVASLRPAAFVILRIRIQLGA